MNGAALPWQKALTETTLKGVWGHGKRVMVAEGQAEPWEAMTLPPNPALRQMFSCRPEDLIGNYNVTMKWASLNRPIFAYLFWGAEYWILRDRSGDPTYLRAMARILDEAEAQ